MPGRVVLDVAHARQSGAHYADCAELAICGYGRHCKKQRLVPIVYCSWCPFTDVVAGGGSKAFVCVVHPALRGRP